ncbi:hypothetical protein C5167_045969 [Papaver somniferum]|uniref:Uncharacterized protein n=1 Tax=Papaver somniferum TaxID=3469 RepID=A0A4Y7LF77_PAPSO|nr:hypothetical protein C5167_045969 [Papaver somniferum]
MERLYMWVLFNLCFCFLNLDFRVFWTYVLPQQKKPRYEGTVWDDLAHGKAVYVAQKGLVKYLLWLQISEEVCNGSAGDDIGMDVVIPDGEEEEK